MIGVGWALLALHAVAFGGPELTADESRARVLFREGDAHYAAGRYEQAAVKFEAAYALSPQPLLLFNLANVYERMANYGLAADYLRRYLDSAEVHDVVSVRERLRRLEMAADSPPVPDVAQEGPRAELRGPSWPIWTLTGGAVAATATAITFERLMARQQRELTSRCAAGPEDETLCLDQAESHLQRESRYALVADVSAAVAVATATSAIVYAIARRGSRGDGRVWLEPRLDRSGGAVSLVVTGRRRSE